MLLFTIVVRKFNFARFNLFIKIFINLYYLTIDFLLVDCVNICQSSLLITKISEKIRNRKCELQHLEKNKTASRANRILILVAFYVHARICHVQYRIELLIIKRYLSKCVRKKIGYKSIFTCV